MKTYVGFWDALFGKKVTLEIPLPNGGIKKVEVSKKWVEQMEREGKITPLSSLKVRVNILDPMGGLTAEQFDDPKDFLDAVVEQRDDHRVEYWTVGVEISEEQYKKFLDPDTKDLYALTIYDAGKPKTRLIQRKLWEQTQDAMKNV